MNLTKCDICKKDIKGQPIKAGADSWSNKDFCLKCGKPILDFLKRHKLLDEEEK